MPQDPEQLLAERDVPPPHRLQPVSQQRLVAGGERGGGLAERGEARAVLRDGLVLGALPAQQVAKALGQHGPEAVRVVGAAGAAQRLAPGQLVHARRLDAGGRVVDDIEEEVLEAVAVGVGAGDKGLADRLQLADGREVGAGRGRGREPHRHQRPRRRRRLPKQAARRRRRAEAAAEAKGGGGGGRRRGGPKERRRRGGLRAKDRRLRLRGLREGKGEAPRGRAGRAKEACGRSSRGGAG